MTSPSGWLVEGEGSQGAKFDDNKSKLFKFTLGEGKVIKAWESGVVGMRKEGKRLIGAPPALGYGPVGMPPAIPPQSTLFFEVDVVKV